MMMYVREIAFPTNGCALRVLGAGAHISGLIPGGRWRSWRIDHRKWWMPWFNWDILRVARLVMVETAAFPGSPFVLNYFSAPFTNAATRREIVVNAD